MYKFAIKALIRTFSIIMPAAFLRYFFELILSDKNIVAQLVEILAILIAAIAMVVLLNLWANYINYNNNSHK